MEARFARDFLNAMSLRESADYEAKFSMDGAKAVIASAERFIEKAVYVYFNNDVAAYAVKNARTLIRLLGVNSPCAT